MTDSDARGHGAPANEPDLAVWLGRDPELALVQADMAAWHEAHPCECEALCECGDEIGTT